MTHGPQDEQAKRRQAERDFLELMQSIEEGSSMARGAGRSGTGGAESALASQRLSIMQVCLSDFVCVGVIFCVCLQVPECLSACACVTFCVCLQVSE